MLYFMRMLSNMHDLWTMTIKFNIKFVKQSFHTSKILLGSHLFLYNSHARAVREIYRTRGGVRSLIQHSALPRTVWGFSTPPLVLYCIHMAKIYWEKKTIGMFFSQHILFSIAGNMSDDIIDSQQSTSKLPAIVPVEFNELYKAWWGRSITTWWWWWYWKVIIN